MKWKTPAIASILMLAILIAGCAAPVCYPPNKIIGNKCCIDDNDNNVCDADEAPEAEEAEEEQEAEEQQEATPVEEEEDAEEEEAEPEEEEEATGLEPGKYDMKLGEPKRYLEINKISAYRSSRDKGVIDEIVFTVRNIGDSIFSPTADLHFDGTGVDFTEQDRVPEYELKVDHEFDLQELDPGEKLIVRKYLGIRFQDIDDDKTIRMSVYDRYKAPREDLAEVETEIVPQELFDSMEIYTYGPPG